MKNEIPMVDETNWPIVIFIILGILLRNTALDHVGTLIRKSFSRDSIDDRVCRTELISFVI